MLYEQNQYLVHYGIKGQKHGIRRFQYEDGTLTEEGKRRYGVTDTRTGGNKKLEKKYQKDISKLRKLDDKANVNLQKQKASAYASTAKKAASIGAAGLGILIPGSKLAFDKAKDAKKRFTYHDYTAKVANSFANRKFGDGQLAIARNAGYANEQARRLYDQGNEYIRVRDDYVKKANMAASQNKTFDRIGKGLQLAGLAIGTGGLGLAAVKTGKAIAAKRRISEKGHPKAVAKRKAQYSRMQKMYANTKYSDILKTDNEKIKRNRNA